MDAAPRLGQLDEGLGETSSYLDVRVHALEQQAELSEFRKSLDDAAALSRRQEQRMRQQRGSLREVLRQLEEVEAKVDFVQKKVESVTKDVERMDATVGNQEKRASHVEQVSGSLKRGSRGGASESLKKGFDMKGPEEFVELQRQLWQILQDFERRLLEEADIRAAGQQDVLGVLGQGIQTLRTEQARHATDLDEKLRAEQKRLRQRATESQARQAELEQRTDSLEVRVDGVSQAVAVERRALAIGALSTSAPGSVAAPASGPGSLSLPPAQRGHGKQATVPSNGASGALQEVHQQPHQPDQQIPVQHHHSPHHHHHQHAQHHHQQQQHPHHHHQKQQHHQHQHHHLQEHHQHHHSQHHIHQEHQHQHQHHQHRSQHHNHHEHHHQQQDVHGTHNNHQLHHQTQASHPSQAQHQQHQQHQHQERSQHHLHQQHHAHQPHHLHQHQHATQAASIALEAQSLDQKTEHRLQRQGRHLPRAAEKEQSHHPHPEMLQRLEALESRFRGPSSSPSSPSAPVDVPVEVATRHTTPEGTRRDANRPQSEPPGSRILAQQGSPPPPPPLGAEASVARGLTPPPGIGVQPFSLGSGQVGSSSSLGAATILATPEPPWHQVSLPAPHQLLCDLLCFQVLCPRTPWQHT
mmetsp:Transcript_102779/g.182596  ORF Transcript_102779/g.182596 Transcript_102779/m.182596 type:complete len:638 (-) Transcript_102779:17-1930(-)